MCYHPYIWMIPKGRNEMTISERLFQIMKDKGITQSQLSRMTGISTRTICAWNKLGTNPGADKIMVICEALEITPEMLLTGKDVDVVPETDFLDHHGNLIERRILADYRGLSEDKKRRLVAYMSMLVNIK